MSESIFSVMGKEDISEVAYNWQVIFGDSKETAARLITAFSQNGVFYTAQADGIIAASVGLVDMSYRLEKQELPTAYVYAAMTLPEYRGEGLMSGLMKHALRECHRSQIPVCAVYPATDSLYDYYGRFGFHTAFFAVKANEIKRNMVGSEAVVSESPDGIYRMHKSVPYSLQKPKEVFELAVREWTRYGGEVKAVPGGYAFLRQEDDRLFVKELISSDIDSAKNYLAGQYPGKAEYCFFMPFRAQQENEMLIPMGQARITHTEAALKALAAERTELNLTVKTVDALIPENAGVFQMKNGSVKRLENSGKFDRELTEEELCHFVLTGGGRGKPYFNIVFD